MVCYQYLTTNQVLLLYFPLDMHAGRMRPFIYTFSSNHNIHKSSYGLCFWASYHLVEQFYKYLLFKESEAQK